MKAAIVRAMAGAKHRAESLTMFMAEPPEMDELHTSDIEVSIDLRCETVLLPMPHLAASPAPMERSTLAPRPARMRTENMGFQVRQLVTAPMAPLAATIPPSSRSNSPFAAYFVPTPPPSVRPAPIPPPKSALPYTLALSLMAIVFTVLAIAQMGELM